jgi:hypothetical protein
LAGPESRRDNPDGTGTLTLCAKAPGFWGNVRQLDRAHRGLLAALAADPRLLPGREELAFIDVEVAETGYTAFTSKPKKEQVPAWLIVRRVRARNDKSAQGQDELFPA